MVQNGSKTDHLEHLGDHGLEMIHNGTEDDIIIQATLNGTRQGLRAFQDSLDDTLRGFGPEIIKNYTKTDHVEHVGGLGPEMVQNGTNTDHLQHLGALVPEMDGTKTNHLEAWAALGPKWSKMVPKL